jgi:hypothetical protein
MDIETTGVKERSEKKLMNLHRYGQHLYIVNIRACYFLLIYNINKYNYNLKGGFFLHFFITELQFNC